MEYLGFPRPDGSVGIRNHVLVIPGGMVAQKICDFVPGTRTIVTPDTGNLVTSRDRETVARTLYGLGLNPNVAAVIVLGGVLPGGHQNLSASRLADEIARSGKPVEIVDIDEEGGTLEAISKGIKLAREMVLQASKVRREPSGLDKLVLGVKCGASDPTSGMVGNPTVGYLYDRLIDLGGTAMFGETTEIIGAEHLLARRAVNRETAAMILEAARFIETRALATGEDIRSINPVPENIAAGISTLEEKSLGAIRKAGAKPIQGVLRYAERPSDHGLFFVDNWALEQSIFTGYAAAGAQLTIYQYGGGGVHGRNILDPSPAVVAPLLWTSANPKTYHKSSDSLDFYSGTVIEGTESPEEVGERFLAAVADVASGTLTRGETVNYSDPTRIYTLDPVF